MRITSVGEDCGLGNSGNLRFLAESHMRDRQHEPNNPYVSACLSHNHGGSEEYVQSKLSVMSGTDEQHGHWD